MARITKKRLREQTALLLVNDPTLTIEEATKKARDFLRGLDSANETFDTSPFLSTANTLDVNGTPSLPVKRVEEGTK